MHRSYTKVKIGDHQTRHSVRLYSDFCEYGTHAARVAQSMLIQTIADTPQLVTCGPTIFDKLVIKHDGERWVVEAEAIVNDEGA